MPATTVDRRATARGEVCLRRRGADYELIVNGTFAMSTEGGGVSESLLVSAALARSPRPRRVLIGGLGVGYSLAAALADERVEQAVVVEIEPAVIDWHHQHLARCCGLDRPDPRTEIACADVGEWLAAHTARFDVVCLDVDNGPGWTILDANARLYTSPGLESLAGRLTRDGVLSVWSAAPAPLFAARLRERFVQLTVHPSPARRGGPDVVYVARGPRATGAEDDREDGPAGTKAMRLSEANGGR